MGYSTKFRGVLRFVRDPTLEELRIIAGMEGEDLREHPEWRQMLEKGEDHWHSFDLRTTPGITGLEWNDMDKTYGLEHQVNLLLRLIPNLRLEGELLAQGDEIEDRWILRCEPGKPAVKIAAPPDGARVVCPKCRAAFIFKAEARP